MVRDIQIDKNIQIVKEIQMVRHTDGQRHTDEGICRWTKLYRLTDRQMDRDIQIETDRWKETYRLTERQMNRDIQMDKGIQIARDRQISR